MKLLTVRLLTSVIIFLFISSTSQAQDLDQHDQTEKLSGYFRASFAVSHTFFSEDTREGKEVLILPTIGLDLEWWFSHKWGIGLHNDLELFIFEIKEDEDLFVEREYPLLITLDALWKPFDEFVFFTGPGIEFEPEKNYFVFRAGFEYEIIINDHWDASPILFYDMRNGAYNTFTVGLGLGYRTIPHKH